MAFYVYAWRDVRTSVGDAPAGTKDVPRVEQTIKKVFVEKATDPLAADLLTPLKDLFPQKAHADATWWTATADAAAAASAAAAIADETTTVTGFRHGKGFLQFGCGTGVSAAAALAAINWKNL